METESKTSNYEPQISSEPEESTDKVGWDTIVEEWKQFFISFLRVQNVIKFVRFVVVVLAKFVTALLHFVLMIVQNVIEVFRFIIIVLAKFIMALLHLVLLIVQNVIEVFRFLVDVLVKFVTALFYLLQYICEYSIRLLREFSYFIHVLIPLFVAIIEFISKFVKWSFTFSAMVFNAFMNRNPPPASPCPQVWLSTPRPLVNGVPLGKRICDSSHTQEMVTIREEYFDNWQDN